MHFDIPSGLHLLENVTSMLGFAQCKKNYIVPPVMKIKVVFLDDGLEGVVINLERHQLARVR